MNAWTEIVCADNSDAWTSMCDRALAEVRREAAAKIRKLKAVVGPAGHTAEAVRDLLEWAAQDVDPEVSDEPARDQA